MLSPRDIAEKRFEKGTFGYKPEDVDAYLLEVSKLVEALVAENEESDEKIIKLVEKINEYRNDEEAIKEALLGAQKQGHQVLTDAQEKADKMISDAKAEQERVSRESAEQCDRIVREHKAKCERIIKENTEKTEYKIKTTKLQAEKEAENLEKLKLEVTRFKAKLTELYNKQLKLIMELPEITEEDIEKIIKQKEEEAKQLEESRAIIKAAEELKNSQPAKPEEAFPYEGNTYAPEDTHFSDLKFGKNN